MPRRGSHEGAYRTARQNDGAVADVGATDRHHCALSDTLATEWNTTFCVIWQAHRAVLRVVPPGSPWHPESPPGHSRTGLILGGTAVRGSALLVMLNSCVHRPKAIRMGRYGLVCRRVRLVHGLERYRMVQGQSG
jgi:hypothetical protein